MKKYFSIVAFSLTFGSITIAQGTKTNIPAAPVKLKNTADSMQYVMGAFIGQWIKGSGFTLTNPSLFNQAMDNVLSNRKRAIPDSMIEPLVSLYLQSTQKNRALNQEQELFLAVKDKPGLGSFPNGIKYLVLKQGRGPRPTTEDSITINLFGKLPDGTIVENTYMKKPYEATIGSFFPALEDVLQNMNEGSKWQLFIPASLAYGDKGTKLIPPNSALILEAEIVAVRRKK